MVNVSKYGRTPTTLSEDSPPQFSLYVDVDQRVEGEIRNHNLRIEPEPTIELTLRWDILFIKTVRTLANMGFIDVIKNI